MNCPYVMNWPKGKYRGCKMDIEKIQYLLDNLKNLKDAGFSWDYENEKGISFYPKLIIKDNLGKIRNDLTRSMFCDLAGELNRAISPVLDKYINLIEEKIKEEVNKES